MDKLSTQTNKKQPLRDLCQGRQPLCLKINNVSPKKKPARIYPQTYLKIMINSSSDRHVKWNKI